MTVINPGFMSIIIADYGSSAVGKKFIYLTKSRQSTPAAERLAWRWAGNNTSALLLLKLFTFSPFSAATWQQPGGAGIGKLELEVLKSFALSEMSEPVRSCAPMPVQCRGGSPLLLLSRPPYIAAGKQMSGHKYAHKLQGKKAVGGAVGVASTVRTAPSISYTMRVCRSTWGGGGRGGGGKLQLMAARKMHFSRFPPLVVGGAVPPGLTCLCN